MSSAAPVPSCANCHRELARVASVICAACPTAPNFCLSCFTSGAEPGSHEAGHPYRIKDNLHAMRIFRADWSAAEELALLDGVLKHGLGNWRDVAAAVGTKSERRCEEHYLDGYLGRHGRVLPARTLAKTLLPADATKAKAKANRGLAAGAGGNGSGGGTGAGPGGGRGATSGRGRSTSKGGGGGGGGDDDERGDDVDDFGEETVDTETLLPPSERLEEAQAAHAAAAAASAAARAEAGCLGANIPVGPEKDPAPGSACARERLRDLPRSTVQMVQERLASLPGARLGGFLPLRGDFDVEHENGAELLLADMEFRPSDPPAERRLKLDVARVYNAKLDERERRKRFVIERGLVDYQAQAAEDRKRPRDERDLLARMRVFSRFQTPSEHEAFVEGCLEAKRLRKRIALLQHYRSVGIRTMAEAHAYELERDAQQAIPSSSSSSSSFAAAAPVQGGGNGSNNNGGKHPMLIPAAAAAVATTGATLAASMDAASSSSSSFSSSSPLPPESSGGSGGGGGGESAVKSLAARVASPAAPHAALACALATDDVVGAAALDPAAQAALDVATGAADRASVLACPLAALLSGPEVDLCASLQLQPKHYLAAKDALVRQALASGYLPTKPGLIPPAQVVKLDVHRRGQVVDFFIDCGWLASAGGYPVVTTATTHPAPAAAAPAPASGSTVAAASSTPGGAGAMEVE